MSHEFKPIWIRARDRSDKDWGDFVAATCRGDGSQRFVASRVSALTLLIFGEWKSPTQNSPMILCRLDLWLISNTLKDLVTTTDVIAAIKTDHATISIELSPTEKHVKGPGHWKMDCSLLDDQDCVRDVTAKIPIWLIETSGIGKKRKRNESSKGIC